ncbi:MAG: hypothetical protein J7L71_08965 [Spirochaetaceae bacterium]|nr:hypothetical protein [Spirochaetaceae bacterium]
MSNKYFSIQFTILIIISLLLSCRSISQSDKVSSESIASQSEIKESILQVNKTGPQNTIPEQKDETARDLSDRTVTDSYFKLSDSQIEEIIINTIPGSFTPVINNGGHIKIIYRDLDQNGYKDAFFLVVKNRENLNSRFSDLSDVSYLISNKRQPVDFFLAVYLQLKGTMISMYRIPVGSGIVINDFSILDIKKGSVIPLGINISFQTVKGMNSELIIFSTYNKFSLFSMSENISSHSNFSDIDGDSIIDIIDWEDGLEEGTGYETYLTWYKWNGKEFREYLSTNVVRNLNKFLEQSRLYLSFEQMDDFFRYALTLDDYKRYKSSEKDYRVWLKKIFRSVPGINTEDNKLIDCNKFRSIIFPQILENPFSPGQDSFRVCNLNIRFECIDGYSFIRTVRVKMNPNPFKKPQFSFYLE